MNIQIAPNRLDHILVDGIYTCQRPEILEALTTFKNFLKNENIEITDIVEIGTYHGGFTTILSNVFQNIQIHSFEVDNFEKEHQLLMQKYPNVKVYVENIVDSTKPETIIKNTIKNCLVFCDGGIPCKTYEFLKYSKFLKKNDFIFCHDYIKDVETYINFYKNKIWNWHQVSLCDIQPAIDENNLKLILPEIFEPVVWSSYVKH
jgi:hypothetical protein